MCGKCVENVRKNVWKMCGKCDYFCGFPVDARAVVAAAALRPRGVRRAGGGRGGARRAAGLPARAWGALGLGGVRAAACLSAPPVRRLGLPEAIERLLGIGRLAGALAWQRTSWGDEGIQGQCGTTNDKPKRQSWVWRKCVGWRACWETIQDKFGNVLGEDKFGIPVGPATIT